MADSVNRIAPATVPLSHPDSLNRQRQEKNRRRGGREPSPQRPADGKDKAGETDPLSEAEKNKGKHLDISA